MFEWLGERIAAARETDAARRQGWRFILNPPADEEAIARYEVTIGQALPPAHRAFLRRWDGASLFRVGTMSPATS